MPLAKYVGQAAASSGLADRRSLRDVAWVHEARSRARDGVESGPCWRFPPQVKEQQVKNRVGVARIAPQSPYGP